MSVCERLCMNGVCAACVCLFVCIYVELCFSAKVFDLLRAIADDLRRVMCVCMCMYVCALVYAWCL